MYLRIVRSQTRPGQAAKLARRWEAFIGDQLRAAPGFRHVYFGGAHDADALVAVSVWDGQPDAEAFDRGVHAFIAQERALLRGQPTIEDYEILGEFSAGG